MDGEHFDVTERIGEPGVYELRWTSVPNADYGFATSTYSSGARPTLSSRTLFATS